MPYAQNQGIRIHYEVEGRGPAVVLQHGFTSNLKSWYTHGYVEVLRRDYQLILIDARGHGESDKPHDSSSYMPALRAADVVSVLDDLCLGTACFWGYSMGGRIGFALAKYAPQRITAIIIGGMHAYARSLPKASLLDGSDAEAFATALVKRWGGNLTALSKERREELFANDFRALAASQRDSSSIEDVLPEIKVPCLIYAGDKDAYYPGARASVLSILNGVFLTLHGLDHRTTFQRADVVLPFLIPFLREATRGPREDMGCPQE